MLDELPPDIRNERRRSFLSEFHREVVSIEATNGPIPPPKMLAGYEEALPGAADRILTMAEKQQSHRFLMESEVVRGNVIAERIGTIAGAFLALVTIVGAMILVGAGKSVEGLALIVTEAAALVLAVRKTKVAGAEELQKKSSQSDSNKI